MEQDASPKGVEVLREMRKKLNDGKGVFYCAKCGKEIIHNVKFCRFCGAPQTTHASLGVSDVVNLSNVSKFKLLIVKTKGRWTKRVTIVVIFVLIVVATTAYAVPVAKDYYVVHNSIAQASGEMSKNNYKDASTVLSRVEKLRATHSQRLKIKEMKDHAEKYLKFNDLLQETNKKKDSGEYLEAREILRGISVDYPAYETTVRPLADELQSKIEEQLKTDKKIAEEQVVSESAARAKAQADAKSAARAKTQADEAAQASVNAKIRAEEIAAQTSRDAALKQEQLETERAEEVKKSFRAQLTTGYNSYIQAKKYFNSAIEYSNQSDHLLALSQATAATAALNSASGATDDLNIRFTGLPSIYYSAASNMNSAIDALRSAIGYLVSSEGTTIDNSSLINSYSRQSTGYGQQVSSFLNSVQ